MNLRVLARRLRTTLLLGLVTASAALAEEMALSIEEQVPLLLKVLTYDRNFETKAGTELAIGIVYDPSDRDSSKATTDLGSTLFKYQGKTVKKLPIKYYTIEYTGNADLERFVKEKGISVLYIAPGNARNLSNLLQLSQELHLTTTTGVPEYVRRGAAVGLARAQDRPQIHINLKAARQEGSEFEASFLRYATIVGPR
jgi:hypothetical protein